MSDSREAFEEAAARLGFDLTMRCPESEDGGYALIITQDSWDIWQEACEWQATRTQDTTDSSCNCEARKSLLEIHNITACISEIEELDGTEQLTVSRVKQMAQYINQMNVSAQDRGEPVEWVFPWDQLPALKLYNDPPSAVVPEGWKIERESEERITIDADGLGFYVARLAADRIPEIMLYALANDLLLSALPSAAVPQVATERRYFSAQSWR